MKQERLMQIIRSPHISEKATLASQNREYVFEVMKNATKPEIQKAVELLFKTKVDSVHTLNIKSKTKRFGKVQGHSKAWKKAYVKLPAGHEIDFSGTK